MYSFWLHINIINIIIHIELDIKFNHNKLLRSDRTLNTRALVNYDKWKLQFIVDNRQHWLTKLSKFPIVESDRI